MTSKLRTVPAILEKSVIQERLLKEFPLSIHIPEIL
jgi:hypothetical protein